MDEEIKEINIHTKGLRIPSVRFVLFTVVLGLYLLTGLVKWSYVINPGIIDGSFLINRSNIKLLMENKVSDIKFVDYILLNPKWISIIIFGNIFLCLNISIIYLIYKDLNYIRFTFWFFFWISLASFLMLGFGYFTNTFQYISPIVARIKELQQSPFSLILLIAVFEIIRLRGENLSSKNA